MDWERERNQMVKYQIHNRGIHNQKILNAMRKVPRHKFVPKSLRVDAYEDYPLPIGENQTISQPYIVALMTDHLGLDTSHKVLEIGTGCGYQTAILAEIVDEVYSVEIVPELYYRAQDTLDALGYLNIQYRIGDGIAGWPEAAPFDAVIVAAAPPNLPNQLISQLKTSGKMVIPVGTLFQTLYQVTHSDEGGIQKNEIAAVRFVPMTGKIQESRKLNR